MWRANLTDNETSSSTVVEITKTFTLIACRMLQSLVIMPQQYGRRHTENRMPCNLREKLDKHNTPELFQVLRLQVQVQVQVLKLQVRVQVQVPRVQGQVQGQVLRN